MKGSSMAVVAEGNAGDGFCDALVSEGDGHHFIRSEGGSDTRTPKHSSLSFGPW